jgi:hypothetical protein
MHTMFMGYICKLFFCLFILHIGIPSNRTAAQISRKQNVKITTLSQAISRISQPSSRETILKWKGGRSWTTDDLPWKRVIAVSQNENSELAYLYTALEDSTPVALLEVQGESKYYGHFKANPRIFGGWWVEVTSSKNDGFVDRVTLWKKQGNQFAVFNNTRGKVPQFVAMRVSKDLIEILPFNDSATTFQANVIYNTRTHTVMAMSNYTLEATDLSDIYVRNDQDEWIEYAYSPATHNLSAIGLHGKSPGKLKRCLLDLTGEGKADIQFGYSPHRDSLLFYSTLKENIFNKLNIDTLKETLIEGARIVTTRWNEARSLFYSINALGYQFPEVKPLPIQAKKQ